MKDVAILMSTYNGEKYILKQLDSLLIQQDVSFDIWIRDDGSTDSTIKIIEDIMKIHSNIFLVKGENLKPKLSFLKLLKDCDEYHYYAYCDQDDIWDKDKLSKAVHHLQKYDSLIPCCYFSNYRLIDSKDNIIQEYGNKYLGEFYFNNIIIDNPAPGGAMVINKAARDIICMAPYPKNCVMHDRWTLLICAAVGNIHYDNLPSYSYRQHENNFVGYGKKNLFSKIKVELCDLFTYSQYPIDLEMKELLFYYCKYMNPSKQRILTTIAQYKHNLIFLLKLMCDSNIKSYNSKRTILFKIKVLLKRR